MAIAKLHEIAQAAQHDPAAALINALPKAAWDYEVFHNKVLVATYVPPEVTKGGIVIPVKSMAESRFQGKVGLVLKVGPLAFKDDKVNQFGGVTVKEGDWIVFRYSDAVELFFVDDNGRTATSCRLIDDSAIFGRTPDPALIY